MHDGDFEKMISRQSGESPQTVHRVLEAFKDVLTLVVRTDEEVVLRKFGRFEPRMKKASTRPHPQTGEYTKFPERRTITFRPAPTLKDDLNGNGS